MGGAQARERRIPVLLYGIGMRLGADGSNRAALDLVDRAQGTPGAGIFGVVLRPRVHVLAGLRQALGHSVAGLRLRHEDELGAVQPGATAGLRRGRQALHRIGRVTARHAGLSAQQLGQAQGHRTAAHLGLQTAQQGLGTVEFAQFDSGQCGAVKRGRLLRRAAGLQGVGLGVGLPGAQRVHTGVGQEAGAGGHHQGLPVCGRRWRGRRRSRGQTDAVLHVGDALGGQRMAAQVGEIAAVIEPVGHLQLFKHADKTFGRKAGGRAHAKADTVGLALHVAREVELALDGRRLPADDHGVGRVGAIAFGGRQHAQNHGANHPRLLGALLADIARNMALGDVAELMPEHRGQLIAAGNDGHQPQMQPELAARQRKRVHRAVARQQDIPGIELLHVRAQIAAGAGGVQQGLPNALHIAGDDRIVHIVGIAVQAAGNTVAQAALGGGRHLGAVAQIGQVLGRRRRTQAGARWRRHEGASGQCAHQRAGQEPCFEDPRAKNSVGHPRMMHLLNEATVNGPPRRRPNRLRHEHTHPL